MRSNSSSHLGDQTCLRGARKTQRGINWITNTAGQAIKIVDSIEKQSLLIMAIGIDYLFYKKKEVSPSKSLYI